MKNQKKEERIQPSLQFIVLCDGVTNPDPRGKVSFIGIFDKFLRLGIIPHFAIALCWKNGKGDFVFKVRLLDPDLKQLFITPEMKLHLEHETEAGRAVLNIDGMNFSRTGVYWIEVLLDDETIQSLPLPVESGAS